MNTKARCNPIHTGFGKPSSLQVLTSNNVNCKFASAHSRMRYSDNRAVETYGTGRAKEGLDGVKRNNVFITSVSVTTPVGRLLSSTIQRRCKRDSAHSLMTLETVLSSVMHTGLRDKGLRSVKNSRMGMVKNVTRLYVMLRMSDMEKLPTK